MPTVTMPDGTQVQMPDNPDPALLSRLKAFQTAKNAPQPSAVDNLLSSAKNLYGSYLEPAAAMASGAIAKPVSDLAGLGAVANHALGLSDDDPDAIKAATQTALTYRPRTDAGKSAMGVLGKVGDVIGKGAAAIGQSGADDARLLGANQGVQDVVRSGATEFANQVPNLLGTKLPEIGASKVAKAGEDAIASAPYQAQVKQATDAGYHVAPTDVSGAPVGSTLVGVAGKDQLNKVLSLHNQKVTNSIAKHEVGIDPGAQFDHAALDSAATRAGEAYEAVKKADQNVVILRTADGTPIKNANGKYQARPAGPIKLDETYANDIAKIDDGTSNGAPGANTNPEVMTLKAQLENATSAFTPTDAIENLKRLRFDAKANLKNAVDPEKLALGQAQKQAADALESQVERYLQSTGQTSLYKDFTAARTKLAKINTIQDAMDASGNVDAAAINAYRNRGGYVAGGLKKIADAADTFGSVVRNTQKVQAPAPFSKLGFYAAMAGGGGLGGQLAGHAGAAGGATLGALMAAPHLAQKFLNSGMYQDTLGAVTPSASPFASLAAHPASPLAGLLATQDPQQ